MYIFDRNRSQTAHASAIHFVSSGHAAFSGWGKIQGKTVKEKGGGRRFLFTKSKSQKLNNTYVLPRIK